MATNDAKTSSGDTPAGVLIIGIDDSICKHDFIKDLIAEENMPAKVSSNINGELISFYDWHLLTRYYKANIPVLLVGDDDDDGDDDVLNQLPPISFRAVCLLLDPNRSESWKKCQKIWDQLTQRMEDVTNLLICKNLDNCSEKQQNEIQDWCLLNTFELVELFPIESDENDKVEDLVDRVGMDRIREALNVCSWPQMEILSTTKDTWAKLVNYRLYSQESIDKLSESEVDWEICGQEAGNCQEEEEEKEKNDLISGLHKKEDDDDDDSLVKPEELSAESATFEELFSKFSELKEHADGLEGNEKYTFAESIAKAFLSSMNIDDDSEEEEEK